MVIESLDNIVNAVPNISSTLAKELLVDTSSVKQEFSSEKRPVVPDILRSRVFGYLGGVGMQAVALGSVTIYQTNSVLMGIGVGVSSAVIPVAVKTMKYVNYFR